MVHCFMSTVIIGCYSWIDRKYIKYRSNRKQQNMLAKIYISDPQTTHKFYTTGCLETEYTLDKKNVLHSQNIVFLYGLCIHLYSTVSREQYNQIQDGELEVDETERQKAVDFMGSVCSKFVKKIKTDYDAKIMLEFLQRDHEISSGVLMILKFQSDVEMTTTLEKKEGQFVILYSSNEKSQALINDFRLVKVPICNEVLRRKLDFLNLIHKGNHQNNKVQQKDLNIYGLSPDKDILITVSQIEGEAHSITDQSAMTQKQSQQSQIHTVMDLKFQNLLIAGLRSAVHRFQMKLEIQLDQVRYKCYRRGDQEFNLQMFFIMRTLAENYRKCKIFVVNGGQGLHVYYHSDVEELLNVDLMRYREYCSVKMTPALKGVLKEDFIAEIRENIPDLIVYNANSEGQMLLGKKQLIQFMSQFCKPKNLSSPSPNSKIPPQPLQPPAPKLQFLNNIQIDEQNSVDLFELASVFKMQQHMNFKIEIGEYIRIINRVKKCSVVYLVFRDFVELMQLQAIIQEEIDHKEILRVIMEYEQEVYHKPKELCSINKQITIKLFPLTQQMPQGLQSHFLIILKSLRAEQLIFLKTIVCSYQTLQQILSKTVINFHITFAIPQSQPLIELDPQFEKQTEAVRLRTGKIQNEYYCEIKTDIINKDYRDQSNLRKEENILREICKLNIHQYEIGEYLLNEVDQFNISYMIGEGLKRMFFVLSKKPTEEFIYLTFHQKLYKLIRDRKGNFQKLEEAFMRDISRNNQLVLRPALHRAFLTGQKYVAINIPFQHVKLVQLSNITRLETGNLSLIKYYLGKIGQSQRYKVSIKPPCTVQHFQRKFSKKYTLRFENDRLKKQIKSLDLGYGNIKKWRERPLVCMRASHFICEKVLRKFELFYSQEDRKEIKAKQI